MTVTHPTIAIAVPLQAELIAAIRASSPGITVLYEPELLPPERFAADHAGDPRFQRSPEQERRYWDMLMSADILLGFPNDNAAGLARIAANPKLEWIQAMASGAGGTVRAARLSAKDLDRIAVTSSAGVHALPLAEFAMLGLLGGFKRVPELAADQSAKHWPELRTPTRMAQGSHIVIAGLGEIGLETARLARALGMTVSGTKHRVGPIAGIEEVAPSAELPRLLGTADALINTLPGTPDTERLIGAEVFAAMQPGTVVVNVGRGSVIDEPALLAALDNGQVGYACLDVFAVEPLPADSALWGHPRVLVSPHSAALGATENQLITERFIENLQHFLAGAPLLHVVDPQHFY
ncbi:D-2-hydroxyacid dehydrogenase [Specibacter sp. NPDC057265]|uniref:D-2-hydroxyacid dehydrogenase n=1 Tax=Specibacter sp. NPDC057265 TaxID=3346075 RepID=UPI00362D3A0F